MAKPRAELEDQSDEAARDLSIDMEVTVILQPIKLIYRPTEIEKLVNFFYVEDLKPEIKQ